MESNDSLPKPNVFSTPAGKREFYEGIKTFFVVPDLSLMPEDFLSHFFLRGFEVYYLMDDQYLDILLKIHELFSLFKELILFVNIDRKLGRTDWIDVVRSIKREYGERARIGVLYGSHHDEETRRKLERIFLYEIGISCGCIPIDYRKQKNLALLQSVLVANEANGRRKSLRAICGATCSFNLIRDGARYDGTILDISVSHFSCTFEGLDPKMAMYEKATGIQLKLAGIICTVNAVVFTKRTVKDEMLYIFVFRSSRDREGLDADMLSKVNGFIHSHFDKGMREVTRKAFEAAIARKREGH